MKRIALVVSAAALVFGLAVAGGAPAATAAEDSGDAISWSVSPADESGEDGRFSIEHELDPGESVEEHIIVRNLGTTDVVFSLSAADGFYTDAGRFDMLPSGQESVDAGSWIEIPSEVSVPAGGSAIVPFTVTVPENAEPGDHAAGVAASVMSVKADGSGGTGVGVESRVGVKVITRVTGALTPSFAVQNVNADFQLNGNPFKAGGLTVTFDILNTGNSRMDAAGTLSVAGQELAFPAAGEHSQVLLPGESRSFTLRLSDIWPLFMVNGNLNVAPVAASLGGETVEVTPLDTPISAWAMPWPQLALVLGVVLIAVALFWNRKRSRRRLQDMISEAVERGREEALDEAKRETVN